MAFFEKIFGKKNWEKISEDVENVEEKKIEKTPEADMSRRKFLKLMGYGAAGAAIGAGTLGPYLERLVEFISEKEMTEAEFKEYKELLEGLVHETNRNYGSKLERTVENELEIKKIMSDKLGGNISGFLEKAYELDYEEGLDASTFDRLNEIYRHLADLGCHHFVYEFFSKKQMYDKKRSVIDRDVLPYEHGSVYSTDFLPKSDEIESWEIDPRRNLNYRPRNLSARYSKQEIKANITEYPGWSDKEKMAEFRNSLDNPEIRKILQSSENNLKLAESYLLLKKAIVKRRFLDEDEEHLPSLLMEELQDYNNLLENEKEIFGPETNNFLLFGYGSKKLDVDEYGNYIPEFDILQIEESIKAAGVEKISLLDAASGGKADKYVNGILNFIKYSEGDSVIYLNTHGNEDLITIGDEYDKKDENSLEVNELADVLAERAMEKNDLDKLTFVNDFCKGSKNKDNTFSLLIEKLVKEVVKKILEISKQKDGREAVTELLQVISDLKLPTVISMSEEGNKVYREVSESLNKFSTVMQEEDALTWKTLLKKIFPYNYGISPMDYYADDKSWPIKIGEREIDGEKKDVMILRGSKQRAADIIYT
ncbi:MAG: twin-arginine translocation signal domain-containing protein [Candidatus Magasanikbacteria bacterium]|nr:twin-arginine translocation signal domain-containing protein [Candidatus Magasanikbacteria bacterium]